MINQQQESPETVSTFKDELDKLYRLIIDKMTGRLIVLPHLNPDWKIGLIGEPGDCKSITGTKLLIRDFMLHGIKCFSNMRIKVTVTIPDDNPVLKAYGLPGGSVVYETQDLDKYALFHFDEMFRGSAIFVDEINLEMAEARRSSSNLNLNTNKVGQELRHLQAALIYTVIDEMWIDGRIRQLTDVFIKTQDTALDPDNLAMKKTPGEVARLLLYPMSRKINGVSYYTSHEAAGPYYLHVRDMWSAYDTLEIQASQSLKYGIDMKPPKNYAVETAPTSEHKQVVDQWAWLNKIATELIERDERYIVCDEIYNHPEVTKRGISKNEITILLKDLIPGIRTDTKRITGGDRKNVYIMPFELSATAVSGGEQ